MKTKENKQQIFENTGSGSIPELWDEELDSLTNLFGDKTNYLYYRLMHLRKLATAGMKTVEDDDSQFFRNP